VTYRTFAAAPESALGREMVISKDNRPVVRARFYRSGARFYILTAKSDIGLSPVIEPTDVDPATESGSDNDPAVTHFLTSFHVATTTDL
jgi:hypothetical protein